MPLYNFARVFGSIMFPIRTICNNTSRQVRIFKGIKGFKCNAYLPTRRQPTIRFRKGNYRRICQSSFPLEGLSTHQKQLPITSEQFMDEFRLNGYFIPMSRYTNNPSIVKIPVGPFIRNRSYFAQAKVPGTPAPGKGETAKEYGQRIGKLDAINEKGYFQKENRSKLEQIKQMLRDKAMLRGTSNTGKVPPKA